MAKEKKETTFEDDVYIDDTDLKGEVRKQPNLYFKWGKKYAKAKGAAFSSIEILKITKSEAKAELERVRAGLDLEVRENWGILGFDKKPTEGAISAWVVTQQAYVDQHKKYITSLKKETELTAVAIEEEETLESAKLAMSNKKISLQDLCQMRVTEYYAEPKIDGRYREISKEEQEASENEVSEELNQKMSQRRKQKK